MISAYTLNQGRQVIIRKFSESIHPRTRPGTNHPNLWNSTNFRRKRAAVNGKFVRFLRCSGFECIGLIWRQVFASLVCCILMPGPWGIGFCTRTRREKFPRKFVWGIQFVEFLAITSEQLKITRIVRIMNLRERRDPFGRSVLRILIGAKNGALELLMIDYNRALPRLFLFANPHQPKSRPVESKFKFLERANEIRPTIERLIVGCFLAV